MKQTTLGLRERQRLQVSSAIHEAAAESVLKYGWAATTVDEIAATAGVSSRTFFNYYASKEDAALGFQELHVPEEALQDFRESSQELLERTVWLTMAILRTSLPPDGIGQRRTTLIRTVPELRLRLKHVSSAANDLLAPILLEELSRARQVADSIQSASLEEEALALRMLAGTILHFAFVKDPIAAWQRSNSSLTAAISLFREVTKSSS